MSDERPPTRGRGYLENYLARKRAQKARTLIPGQLKHGAALDIGCGFTPYFLLQSDFSRKYGLERGIDEGFKTKMSREKNITLVEFDVEQHRELPFGNDSFDIVAMLAVIEHVEPKNILGILQDIRRVLRPQGVLILTTPSKWTKGLLRFLASVNMVSRIEIEEHKTAYTRKEIISLFKEAGFSAQAARSGYFECLMNTWAVAAKSKLWPG